MKWILRSEFGLFWLFFLILVFLYPNLVEHLSLLGGEYFEDSMRYLYSLERLRNLSLPLWNPYHQSGEPHSLYLLLTSFPSPLDPLVAQGTRLLDMGGAIGLVYASDWIFLFNGALFCLGFYKLSRFWAESILGPTLWGQFCALGFSLYAVITFFDFGYFGQNYVYILTLIYPQFALYYLSRILMREMGKARVVKLALATVLLFYNPGSFGIQAGITLVTFFLFHLLLRSPQGWILELRALLGQFTRVKLQTLLGLSIFLFGLMPHGYITKFELPLFERSGRDLASLNYQDVVNAEGGIHLEKFLLRLNRPFPFTPLIFVFLCFSSAMSFSKQKRLAIFALLLSIFSLVLGKYSPFLFFYYYLLFPFLQKVLYLNIYTDLFSLFALAFAVTGATALAERLIEKKVALLAVAAGTGLLFLVRNELNLDAVNFCGFILFLVALWGLTQTRLLPLGFCFGTLLVGFLGLNIGLHFLLLNQYVPGNTHIPGQIEATNFPFASSYGFNSYRQQRAPYRWEIWLNGTTFLEKKSYLLAPRFVDLKSTLETFEILKTPDKIDQYFGVTTPILRFSQNWKVGKLTDHGSTSDYLDESLRIPSPNGDFSAPRELKIQFYDPERLKLALKVDDAGLLVFSQSYHKGWQAEVDGYPAKIYKVDNNFIGLEIVSGGTHTIEFIFRPPEFYLIWTAFGVFWFGAFYCIWQDFCWRKRPDRFELKWPPKTGQSGKTESEALM